MRTALYQLTVKRRQYSGSSSPWNWSAVGPAGDAALGDPHDPGGDPRREALGAGEIDREIPQVPAVHAHDPGSGVEGGGELLLHVDLDERVESFLARRSQKLAQLRGRED